MVSHTIPRDGIVLDVGCGTGYYLAGALDKVTGARGLGLDLGACAAGRCARPRASSRSELGRVPPVSVGRPVGGCCAEHVRSAQPRRVSPALRPNGSLIVVRPTVDHLAELRRDVPDSVTIDVSKEQRLHDALAPFFEQERDQHVGYIAEIEPQTARDLLGMTPSARHITPAEVSDDDLPERVTISVLVSSYRLRET